MSRAKRKQVTMTVTVSCPSWLTAAQARKEVRSLINAQAHWGHHAMHEHDFGCIGEENFRAVSVAPGKAPPSKRRTPPLCY